MVLVACSRAVLRAIFQLPTCAGLACADESPATKTIGSLRPSATAPWPTSRNLSRGSAALFCSSRFSRWVTRRSRPNFNHLRPRVSAVSMLTLVAAFLRLHDCLGHSHGPPLSRRFLQHRFRCDRRSFLSTNAARPENPASAREFEESPAGRGFATTLRIQHDLSFCTTTRAKPPFSAQESASARASSMDSPTYNVFSVGTRNLVNPPELFRLLRTPFEHSQNFPSESVYVKFSPQNASEAVEHLVWIPA